MEGPAAIVRRQSPPERNSPELSLSRSLDADADARRPADPHLLPAYLAATTAAREADAGDDRECRRGDTVVTAGGIVGRVAKPPQKDDPEITVEIADNVQVRVLQEHADGSARQECAVRRQERQELNRDAADLAPGRGPSPGSFSFFGLLIALPNALPDSVADANCPHCCRRARWRWASICRAVRNCCSKSSSTRCRRTASNP